MSAPPPDSFQADPAALLSEFLDSGRSEPAFGRLVERTGGLVYSSALRRTGDPQLAEEVTQNVFALLARKADGLRHHPSLAAWMLQTTRYQSARAMRAEKRRQRKLRALANDAVAAPPDPTRTGAEP